MMTRSLCYLMLMIALHTAYSNVNEDTIWRNHRVRYYPPAAYPQSPGNTAIFLHAAVGIFQKKRGNGTWGYGREIMNELLTSVKATNLMAPTTSVHVTLLGSKQDRQLARKTISSFDATVSVIAEATNLYVAEFPTLYALQQFAKRSHPDTLILYVHTKGMRNNGQFADDWRRYMTYFLIEHSELCVGLLRKGKYQTCGVLKDGQQYEGNYWWTTSRWITHLPKDFFENFRWNMENRMTAEDFILHNQTDEEVSTSHYCLHHTHHNMYDCPTPRQFYNDTKLLTIRKRADCMNPRQFPSDIDHIKNNKSAKEVERILEYQRMGYQMKSPCHLFGLPTEAN